MTWPFAFGVAAILTTLGTALFVYLLKMPVTLFGPYLATYLRI